MFYKTDMISLLSRKYKLDQFWGIDQDYTFVDDKSGNYIFSVDMPGVEAPSASIIGRTIRVKGIRKPRYTAGPPYREEYMEYLERDITRQIDIPLDGDLDKIECNFQLGVLTVKIPKKSQNSDSRNLEIKIIK